MGPQKRIIGLRQAIRPTKPKIQFNKIDYISAEGIKWKLKFIH